MTRDIHQQLTTASLETRPPKIAIIGLGYVGLPLAALMAQKYIVVGFDIHPGRVSALQACEDATMELTKEELEDVVITQVGNHTKGLIISDRQSDIADADIYIVTVPTPVDKNHQPDLGPVTSASKTVGKYLSEGNIVIYESTVYPGLTEEVCVPILERESELRFNRDFYVGYSPERINPGDKTRRIEQILKITSGSTPEAAQYIDALYKSVLKAGTYLASSIKVAEAAKVIENAQRDINIAFVNELAKICNKLDIPTKEVLTAAGTKWNFQPYQPGLAGGHCIGVDPYYLALKAKQVGYYPGLILAARRMNESMAEYIASQVVKCMIKKGITVKGAHILMLGITFKENCPDVRNTKIVEVIRELETYGLSIDVYDPWAAIDEVRHAYQVALLPALPEQQYDAIVLGVAHAAFLDLDYGALKKAKAILYDVKSFLPFEVDGAL